MFTIPLSLLVAHFVADFLLQDDWMALNKSKDNLALTVHVAVYTAVITLWAMWALYVNPLSTFDYIMHGAGLMGLLTLASHWATDWVTSRITSKLWFIKFLPDLTGSEVSVFYPFHAHIGKTRHWFFVMIGLDQLIHYTTLALTWRFLYGL